MLVRGHVALDRHDELLASLGGVVLHGPEPVAAKTEANLQARASISLDDTIAAGSF